MADLRTMITETETNKQAWAENKKAERDEVSIMSDEGINAITQDPQEYLRYLELQADNPHFSVGNIALVMQQKPESTLVASFEKWKKLGRNINGGEIGIKIMMPEKYQKDGITKTGYKIGRVFDISQTSGKEVTPPIKLRDDTPEMQKALKALIELCPVPIKVVDEGVPTALYMEANKQVYISSELSDTQTFAALSNEIVHAKIHNGGAYENYSRDDCALDAESVSYMVCFRFGVKTEEPDVYDVPNLYDRLETSERRAALDGLQKMTEQMGDKVEKEIAPPEQAREQKNKQEQVK